MPRLVVIGLILAVLSLHDEAALSQDKPRKNNKTQISPDSSAAAARELELIRNWSLGFQHYRNKQYVAATRYFWKVVAIDTMPQQAFANHHETAAATPRKYPQVFDFLGHSYFQLNKPDSAKLVYELGIAALPAEVNLRRRLAYLLTAGEQLDRAAAQYQQIRELGAATEDDFRHLANLHVRLNQYNEAIAAYEKILTLSPDDAETRKALAALYQAAGNAGAAIENMEKALAQNPNDSRLLFDLARARFNLQEYENVVALLSRFHVLAPDDFVGLELLGEAQRRLNRHAEALKTFGKIIAARPQEKKVLVKISDSYRALGDFAAARRFANKALAVDHNFGAAYLALGRIYEDCADQCVAKKGKTEFDDKLVYELAYFQYEKALQDAETRAEARQQLNFLAASIPQKEDRFMNKGRDKATGPCYQWIY
ncbi:MAG: tetratricopeptide repeat protein [candidate division KSB1 bacterium]|nr:tetratricopeptide repeat protein [candidate division KSB1 bacterium]MDZ7366099.1 tetratricopeptide repeat protein [candidate division KSB1 bacterium]MDZ7404259.1 tetratricopeptide repeat protein [candidate division KSB1 bacterium]